MMSPYGAAVHKSSKGGTFLIFLWTYSEYLRSKEELEFLNKCTVSLASMCAK